MRKKGTTDKNVNKFSTALNACKIPISTTLPRWCRINGSKAQMAFIRAPIWTQTQGSWTG